jgi:pyruvate-ferredoxin/flavodoxin oxidoreductase
MYIANATGCSSIWGGSAPSTPFCTNHEGKGPAWANSLFEDNAEFGYGMFLGQQAVRDKLAEKSKALIAVDYTYDGLKKAAQKWLDTYLDGTANKAATKEYIASLECSSNPDLTGTEWEADWIKNGKKCTCDACSLAREILAEKDFLVKKSVWAFGGDGWAYDIGFGGLDHVIAMGEDVNLLVLDTEVYSNTGGQASKATPTAAIAKFAAAGMRTRKKDLGMIAMSYGNVYVAQVCTGANQNQFIKALTEAESYNGPSVIIAYAPCIAHGINMGLTQKKGKDAVDCGYWHLWRYDPRLEAEGKNPFILDSKEPTGDFQAFLASETRYSSLKRGFPEIAGELFKTAEADAVRRYKVYKRYNDVGIV